MIHVFRWFCFGFKFTLTVALILTCMCMWAARSVILECGLQTTHIRTTTLLPTPTEGAPCQHSFFDSTPEHRNYNILGAMPMYT